MLTCDSSVIRALRRQLTLLLVLACVAIWSSSLYAQVIAQGRSAVGGISVDTDGLLNNAAIDARGELARLRAQSLGEISDDLNQPVELRKVSLRRLEKAIQRTLQTGKPLPDEIKYLAGLQQIRYVFVYPEQHDIVLVGPADGWRVNAKGDVVGATSGRPVMLLDDLLVALRSARAASKTGISCSIDPTPEGLVRLNQLFGQIRTMADPRVRNGSIERALGPQTITIKGVPAESHFARVLVAADYRMKRLAMNFDPVPIRGLPSFLQMAKVRGLPKKANMLPRWWLEPAYEPLLRDAKGLAWELRGASVKALAEDDIMQADGSRKHTGKASSLIQRWADNMTQHYDELALADPIFGDLRNCLELAIVSALIVKEDLVGKTDCQMPLLFDSGSVPVEEFLPPKQVASKVSLVKRGRNWIVTASGGVLIDSWAIAHRVEQSKEITPLHAASANTNEQNWWWN